MRKILQNENIDKKGKEMSKLPLLPIEPELENPELAVPAIVGYKAYDVPRDTSDSLSIPERDQSRHNCSLFD
jgi:hypothetical protein